MSLKVTVVEGEPESNIQHDSEWESDPEEEDHDSSESRNYDQVLNSDGSDVPYVPKRIQWRPKGKSQTGSTPTTPANKVTEEVKSTTPSSLRGRGFPRRTNLYERTSTTNKTTTTTTTTTTPPPSQPPPPPETESGKDSAIRPRPFIPRRPGMMRLRSKNATLTDQVPEGSDHREYAEFGGRRRIIKRKKKPELDIEELTPVVISEGGSEEKYGHEVTEKTSTQSYLATKTSYKVESRLPPPVPTVIFQAPQQESTTPRRQLLRLRARPNHREYETTPTPTTTTTTTTTTTERPTTTITYPTTTRPTTTTTTTQSPKTTTSPPLYSSPPVQRPQLSYTTLNRHPATITRLATTPKTTATTPSSGHVLVHSTYSKIRHEQESKNKPDVQTEEDEPEAKVPGQKQRFSVPPKFSFNFNFAPSVVEVPVEEKAVEINKPAATTSAPITPSVVAYESKRYHSSPSRVLQRPKGYADFITTTTTTTTPAPPTTTQTLPPTTTTTTTTEVPELEEEEEEMESLPVHGSYHPHQDEHYDDDTYDVVINPKDRQYPQQQQQQYPHHRYSTTNNNNPSLSSFIDFDEMESDHEHPDKAPVTSYHSRTSTNNNNGYSTSDWVPLPASSPYHNNYEDRYEQDESRIREVQSPAKYENNNSNNKRVRIKMVKKEQDNISSATTPAPVSTPSPVYVPPGFRFPPYQKSQAKYSTTTSEPITTTTTERIRYEAPPQESAPVQRPQTPSRVHKPSSRRPHQPPQRFPTKEIFNPVTESSQQQIPPTTTSAPVVMSTTPVFIPPPIPPPSVVTSKPAAASSGSGKKTRFEIPNFDLPKFEPAPVKPEGENRQVGPGRGAGFVTFPEQTNLQKVNNNRHHIGQHHIINNNNNVHHQAHHEEHAIRHEQSPTIINFGVENHEMHEVEYPNNEHYNHHRINYPTHSEQFARPEFQINHPQQIAQNPIPQPPPIMQPNVPIVLKRPERPLDSFDQHQLPLPHDNPLTLPMTLTHVEPHPQVEKQIIRYEQMSVMEQQQFNPHQHHNQGINFERPSPPQRPHHQENFQQWPQVVPDQPKPNQQELPVMGMILHHPQQQQNMDNDNNRHEQEHSFQEMSQEQQNVRLQLEELPVRHHQPPTQVEMRPVENKVPDFRIPQQNFNHEQSQVRIEEGERFKISVSPPEQRLPEFENHNENRPITPKQHHHMEMRRPAPFDQRQKFVAHQNQPAPQPVQPHLFAPTSYLIENDEIKEDSRLEAHVLEGLQKENRIENKHINHQHHQVQTSPDFQQKLNSAMIKNFQQNANFQREKENVGWFSGEQEKERIQNSELVEGNKAAFHHHEKKEEQIKINSPFVADLKKQLNQQQSAMLGEKHTQQVRGPPPAQKQQQFNAQHEENKQVLRESSPPKLLVPPPPQKPQEFIREQHTQQVRGPPLTQIQQFDAKHEENKQGLREPSPPKLLVPPPPPQPQKFIREQHTQHRFPAEFHNLPVPQGHQQRERLPPRPHQRFPMGQLFPQHTRKAKSIDLSEMEMRNEPTVKITSEASSDSTFNPPTLVQRGFYPILPYSEEDPGIVVVVMPKKKEINSDEENEVW